MLYSPTVVPHSKKHWPAHTPACEVCPAQRSLPPCDLIPPALAPLTSCVAVGATLTAELAIRSRAPASDGAAPATTPAAASPKITSLTTLAAPVAVAAVCAAAACAAALPRGAMA